MSASTKRRAHVVVVGCGPAGFAVARELLARPELDLTIDLVDRAERPDGLLRHGPSAGGDRLRAVATEVDAVLRDPRARFLGGVEVGADLSLDEVCRAADAVVLASGPLVDLPLDVEGSDSVGIGTVSHLDAWLAGGVDAAVEELDLQVDSAVVIGWTSDTRRVVDLLESREAPSFAPATVRRRLEESGLRQVVVVEPRSDVGADDPHVRPGLRPIGVVGRNRARALRALAPKNDDGLTLVQDVRAQLLLRPRGESGAWSGLDRTGDVLSRDGARAVSGGAVVPGLFIAGWAGRPAAVGSHAEDAIAVGEALVEDMSGLNLRQVTLDEVLDLRGIAPAPIGSWSAVAATAALLDRFDGEGTLPLADYDELLEQVDDD